MRTICAKQCSAVSKQLSNCYLLIVEVDGFPNPMGSRLWRCKARTMRRESELGYQTKRNWGSLVGIEGLEGTIPQKCKYIRAILWPDALVSDCLPWLHQSHSHPLKSFLCLLPHCLTPVMVRISSILGLLVGTAIASPSRAALRRRQDETPSVNLGYEIHTATANVGYPFTMNVVAVTY